MSLTMFKNGLWFPYMLIGLLLISVGANIYLVVRANSDPSFAVEPDYYAKAVGWDEQQKEKRASQELGWRVEVKVEPDGVQLEIVDALGRPVDEADVSIEMFHNARAQDRITRTMKSLRSGQYALAHSFNRKGLWEFRFVVVRGQDRFLHTARKEL